MTGSRPSFRHGGCMLLLLLAGCTTPRHQPPSPATTDASWPMVVPPGMVRYRLALGEVSSGGTLLRRVPPAYPPALLAACPPPQEVPAWLIIDGQGRVGEVRVAGEAQADAGRHAFIDAVRAAALQWRFEPLAVEHWAADADGNSHEVDSATKPFGVAYVFRFECRAGKTTVSSAAVPP